jgi:hypothetical protein
VWYYGNHVEIGLVVFQSAKIKAPNSCKKFYEANGEFWHCIHGPFASREEARVRLKRHTPIKEINRMRKLFIGSVLLLLIAMAGCGPPVSVTQNAQSDCGSTDPLLMSGLTPTHLSLVSGHTNTFDASATVSGTHCQTVTAVIGLGYITLTSQAVGVGNTITPWNIVNISFDPALVSGSTGTITLYLTTTDNRTSPTYYIPWTKI